MLRTSPTSRFKRDFKRVAAGPHGKDIVRMLEEVFAFLLVEESLPPRYRDHSLSGDYQDCRDCHLKPDLLLIYRKLDGEVVQLVRLGSHSELF